MVVHENKKEEKPIESANEDETIHYDIDKFIEQLYDCKPLKEQEVKFLIEKSKEILAQEKNAQEVPCPVTVYGDIYIGCSSGNGPNVCGKCF